MEKKIFFCPVCGRVEATDPSADPAAKTCPFCTSAMLEKMTMNWDAVPAVSRNEQRIKWIQEANNAQTFNVDTYNRRMTDPVFANDDASAPAVPPQGQPYGAPPVYGQPYGAPPVYGGQPQPGAQFQANTGGFATKVDSFVNKGGKGMFWIKVLKVVAWASLIAFPLFFLISGALINFISALIGLLLGAIVGIVSSAALMTAIHAAENILTIANNSADVATYLKKEK